MGTIVLRSQESHKLWHHPQAAQGLWGQGQSLFFGRGRGGGGGGGGGVWNGTRDTGMVPESGLEEWFSGMWGYGGSPESGFEGRGPRRGFRGEGQQGILRGWGGVVFGRGLWREKGV